MKYEQTSLCEYGIRFETDGWLIPCERESYLTIEEWKAIDKKIEESLKVSPEAWNRIMHASRNRISDDELKKFEKKAKRLDKRILESLIVPQESLNMVLGPCDNRSY